MKHSERDFIQSAASTDFELEPLPEVEFPGAFETSTTPDFELEPPALLPSLLDAVASSSSLDLRGVSMPNALLRLNRALHGVESGGTVTVQCDAPEAFAYLQAFGEVTGNVPKSAGELATYLVQRK